MTDFQLARQGNVPLMFVGEVLADKTSQRADALRWTELRIYRTSAGSYVTESVGRSVVPGERDRSVVHLADDPAQVRQALLRRPSGGGAPYLTDLAVKALSKAASVDPSLQSTLVEVIP